MDFRIFGALCCLVVLKIGSSQECPSDIDICLPENYVLLPTTQGRCPTCYSGAECDLYGIVPSRWYRYDYKMVNECVSTDTCGTHYTIWMNGTFPSEYDGAVDRIGCLSTFSSCCTNKYGLKVINCGSFNVYCLKELPSGCPQRYCFDSPFETTPASTTRITTVSEMKTSEGTETRKDHFDRTDQTDGSMEEDRCTSPVTAAAVAVLVCLIVFTVVLALVVFKLKRNVSACPVPAYNNTDFDKTQPPPYKSTLPSVEFDIWSRNTVLQKIKQ